MFLVFLILHFLCKIGFFAPTVQPQKQEKAKLGGKIGGKCKKLANSTTINNEFLYKYYLDLLLLLGTHRGKEKLGYRC